MEKGDIDDKRGFTIIEVALVLAIAGLIFLMIFVALPSLRASQRDTDRRTRVIELLDAVKKFQSNNRGALPGSSNQSEYEISWDGFLNNYLGGSKFEDPEGGAITLKPLDCKTAKVDVACDNKTEENKTLSEIYETPLPNSFKRTTMIVVKQATCYGDQAVASKNPRKLAVLYRLERGGVYCNNT